ncbi:MAG: hypothetical protein IAE80_19390 [Anaerolinea sp.]|nr:hypothetical protein [Anaerolinea sp.]
MTALAHLDWQPVILLKVVQMPFGGWGGLSLKRAYIALHDGRLLYADWTLKDDERAVGTTCVTGWAFDALQLLPFRLHGKGAKVIPSGTWALPYTESLFTLYSRANAALTHLVKRIDQYPTDPRTISTLINLSQLL